MGPGPGALTLILSRSRLLILPETVPSQPPGRRAERRRGSLPGVLTLSPTRASSEGEGRGGSATPARQAAGKRGVRSKPLSYVFLKGKRFAQGGEPREGGPGCPPSVTRMPK